MRTLARFSLDSTKTKASNGANGANVNVVLVTPAMATEWMKRNGANRVLRERTILAYARDMAEGRWQVNAEAIKFDHDGNLLDGQHRLAACIQSGVAFKTYVAQGLPPEVFSTIDRGQRRSVADNLHLLGYTNTTIFAAAVADLWRYENGMILQGRSANPTVDQTLATIQRHPGIENSVTPGQWARRFAPAPMLVFLHYVFSKRDPQLAKSFMERLDDGVGLPRNSALWKLRDRLDRNRDARAKLPRTEIMALIIKAWNFMREGRPCTLLRWNPDEGFPEIK